MRLNGMRICAKVPSTATLAGMLLLALLIPHASRGQGEENQATQAPIAPSGLLRIRSEPSGVLVTLAGPHRWRGTTPWDLQRGLEGTYKVTAALGGYERWRRTIDLVRGEVRDLTISLAPKQRWKACARSLLIPGWGQRYSEQPGKAAIFFVASAGAAGALWWFDDDYNDHVDAFRSARDAYLSEENVALLDDKRHRMEQTQRRADRAYDRRQAALFAAAGVYALSALDALLFFPEPAAGTFATISPWGSEGPMISVRGAEGGGVAMALCWPLNEGAAR